MFVAPTEPPLLRDIGVTSLMPEEYGVDIMWESNLGKVGIQRKKFPDDFLASVNDGRLNREYAMMKGLDLAFLLLEGRAQWTTEGNLIRKAGNKRYQWSRSQHRRYLASVQLQGVHVIYTDGLTDTIAYVGELQAWSDKNDHTGLLTRPGPSSGDRWGRHTSRDYQSHVLQSVPGIGPKQAAAILDRFGGLPIRMTTTLEELMTIPGIGKGRAEKLLNTFRSNDAGSHA